LIFTFKQLSAHILPEDANRKYYTPHRPIASKFQNPRPNTPPSSKTTKTSDNHKSRPQKDLPCQNGNHAQNANIAKFLQTKTLHFFVQLARPLHITIVKINKTMFGRLKKASRHTD